MRAPYGSPTRGASQRPPRRLPRRPVRQVRGGGFVGSVTFPTTHLNTKVLIALGADLSADPLTWLWQDITDYVRFDLGILLATGRRDEASQVQTGQGVLKLDNRDGRFTRRNPTSPYYGLLSKNTPIWVTVDAGSGEKTRMEMFINEWPTRWADKSVTDTTVTIRCAGILRRLQQGSRVKSAMKRAILATSPGAYWPLEDDADATPSAGSAVGGPPMRQSGTVTFAAYSDLVGALQTPAMAAGSLYGQITGVSSTSWHAEFAIKAPFTPSAIGRVYASSDTAAVWRLFMPVDSTGSVQVYVTDINTNILFAMFGSTVDATFADEWHHIAITAEQSGSNVAGRLYVDGVLEASGSGAGTLGAPYSFWANHLVQAITSMAHIAVGSGTTISDAAAALDGYVGEMAHERIGRLCQQEGVLFETLASTSTTMGPQGVDSFINLIRETEAVGCGVIYEKRWGLAYQSLAERYNAPVRLALDFTAGHIAEVPEPTDDDQRTRNLWTASRVNGSEFTAEQTTGPMGTGAQGPAIYDDSVTVNTETDTQLSGQAGWRLHLGTVDEDRWPRVDLNFARSPGLINDWTALAYGSRVTGANPPSQMPPADLDLVAEGHAERFDSVSWLASLNTSPASPYRVHVVASTNGNLGRVDSATSTLAADATDVATTISVAVTGVLWRTGAVTFDIEVGGERMTVTNISGGSSPQTFTVTRSVNGVVKAQPATVGGFATKVRLWQPGVYAL